MKSTPCNLVADVILKILLSLSWFLSFYARHSTHFFFFFTTAGHFFFFFTTAGKMVRQASSLIVLLSFVGNALGYTRHACSTPESSSLPYCDTTLPTSTRIQDLIPRLTTSEKVCVKSSSLFWNIRTARWAQFLWLSWCLDWPIGEYSPSCRKPKYQRLSMVVWSSARSGGVARSIFQWPYPGRYFLPTGTKRLETKKKKYTFNARHWSQSYIACRKGYVFVNFFRFQGTLLS